MTGAHQLADLFVKQAAKVKPESALAIVHDDDLTEAILTDKDSSTLILQAQLTTMMAKLDVLEGYLRIIMSRLKVEK